MHESKQKSQSIWEHFFQMFFQTKNKKHMPALGKQWSFCFFDYRVATGRNFSRRTMNKIFSKISSTWNLLKQFINKNKKRKNNRETYIRLWANFWYPTNTGTFIAALYEWWAKHQFFLKKKNKIFPP